MDIEHQHFFLILIITITTLEACFNGRESIQPAILQLHILEKQ